MVDMGDNGDIKQIGAATGGHGFGRINDKANVMIADSRLKDFALDIPGIAGPVHNNKVPVLNQILAHW